MLKEVATESGDADVTICAVCERMHLLSDTQLYCESVLAQLHREYSGEQQRGAEPERGGCHDERGVGGHDSIYHRDYPDHDVVYPDATALSGPASAASATSRCRRVFGDGNCLCWGGKRRHRQHLC
ncbi:hypothetical protein PC111_g17515 [Phytophthora cactorum]|nr:hypothetical protein PC111_g17515 [Phytophthora cactorum]